MLKKRILFSKNITNKINKIKVKSFDKSIKSSRTIKLVQYIKKNNSHSKIFFIMGSDSFMKFHKWHNWKEIPEMCKLVVFPRTGYIKKILTSKTL